MKPCCTVLAIALLTAPLAAQNWTARYDGTGDEDVACGLAADDSGCVYVTGPSWGSGTSNDFATVKYGPAGETLWVRRYDGTEHSGDEPKALAVGSGRVAVTGGTAAANLFTDIMTVVYDDGGDTLWTRTHNGPGDGNDHGLAAAIDGDGNVFVAGYAHDDSTGWDFATIKYGADGTRQWVASYITEYEDFASGVVVDDAGNCYVTGSSGNPYLLTWDIATAKYNTSGVEQWAVRYDGPAGEDDEPYGIAVDGDGNVYVTGSSLGLGTGLDYVTVKYDPAGETLWVRRYDGPASGTDEAHALALDEDGNVYVTGFSQHPDNDFDYATIKYTPGGVEQWVARYDGPVHGFDEARAITGDATGIYVTGNSTGDGTRADYATVKYTVGGAEEWVHRYDGPASRQDEAVAIALDGRGGVVVTGGSAGDGSGTDFATLCYATVGIEETPEAEWRVSNQASIVRGILHLTPDFCPLASDFVLLDASGRRVRELVPGPNSLAGLAPGVYFVRSAGGIARPVILVD